MQQTEKYGFNLIEGGDDFSAAPLNENMVKVEQAVGAVETARIKFQFLHYKGDGATSRTFTFAFKPEIVILGTEDSFFKTVVLFRGQRSGILIGYTSSTYTFGVTWGENSVTLAVSNISDYMCNGINANYHLFAAG